MRLPWDLLAKDGQFIDVQLLKQSYQLNQKIDFALAPIYNHARKLFERDNQNISFERYAKNFMNPVSSPELIDSVKSCKMKTLLTLYFELKNTGSARIDFSSNEIISNIQKEEIEKILNHALTNPELRAERELLIEIGIAILNLVSILCVGLPLLVNYYITGQLFFSHRTKTEELELLNHLKGEITTCIQRIPSLSTSKP